MWSRHEKGLQKELEFSLKLHLQGIPILISSQMLRQRGCGQVDVAIYQNKMVFLFEIKSKKELFSDKQKGRLSKTASFLAPFFQCPVLLKMMT